MTTSSSRSERAEDAAPVAAFTVPPPPVPPAIEWRRAWRAMRRLMSNPEETEQAFETISALSGRDFERVFQRFVADHPPLRRDLLQLGELRHVRVRPRAHRREEVHQRVVRREHVCMIGRESLQLVPHVSAQLNVQNRREPEREDQVFCRWSRNHDVS